ncbi:MAG TPA: apolipoprotein N-acyltransferase [Candidatus Methylacidiphilales bacterium]|nr:apolipoprotein N-acyltransferase [Candidatus Methylacidiphilales bacterium]
MADRWIEKYRWGWCALSGWLLLVSFAPFSRAEASWIALIPAWWVITRSETGRRQPIRHGYLIGLIYFGGSFWWISNVTVIGTSLLVLYLALYPAVWFLLVARLLPLRQNSKPVLWSAFAAAALWVTLEWWRSWFLTGFNWNELGVSQAPSIIFRQFAAFGGVPLISFFLVTVNVLWAEGVFEMISTMREKRRFRVPFPFAAGLLLVALGFAFGWHHLHRHWDEKPNPGVRFACIQPDIPQLVDEGSSESEFENRQDAALDATVKLSIQAITDKPALLVWPEAMIDEEIFRDRPFNEAVRDLCGELNGWFLLGSGDFDAEAHKLYNCAYLFSPGGDKYEYYQKTRLVLLGEYLPFGDTFPWLRRAIGVGMDFTPGPGPKRFMMENPDVSFCPLICYEDTLPEVTSRAARLHPDFFVTITNDGWYQGWCAEWGVRQHLANAVFRCIEQDRPMLRCANNGISCVVDQNGTVTERFRNSAGNSVDVAGIFAGQLVFYPQHSTLYQAWGDWIVLISSLATGMLGIRFFLGLFIPDRES